jgi:cysteine synthase
MVAQPGATAAGSRPTPAVASAPQVDVEAVLNGMAQQTQTKLNWRTSIVDLMKLVGMDSALSARKELAQELGYTGSTSDSATLNVWLHKQVMKKIADNGGKLPDDLKA